MQKVFELSIFVYSQVHFEIKSCNYSHNFVMRSYSKVKIVKFCGKQLTECHYGYL